MTGLDVVHLSISGLLSYINRIDINKYIFEALGILRSSYVLLVNIANLIIIGSEHKTKIRIIIYGINLISNGRCHRDYISLGI